MSSKFASKAWFRNAVLYDVYPLSFADGDGDGFGDLRGLIQRLPYLAGSDDSLGVGAIWLSPIYQSPMADWGYDVSDHCAIDPRFGTMADFAQLVTKAHQAGLKVILDFIPNHTSIEHRWFNESRASRGSARRDWYIWADPKPGGSAPNNWLARFGGSAWTLDEHTGQYYLHSFLPEQPDLNWHNPEVREAMLGVLKFWLARGVDGFRTDAILSVLKDPRLRDNPINPNYQPGVSDPADILLPVYSQITDGIDEVLASFCEVLASAGDGHYLLSEARLDIKGMAKLYRACQLHPVHAPFNFNLMDLEWGAASFKDFIDEYEASLRPQDWPNYVLGSHDRHRMVTRLGVPRSRLMAMLQLTLRGLPVIYYGDELGLPDSLVAASQVRDHLEQRVPGLGLGRDPQRGPMVWEVTPNGGFSTGTPWLPPARDGSRLSVQSQQTDPDSSLNLYRHLIHLRAHLPALSEGDYRSLDSGNDQIYAYMRETGYQRVCIILNFSDQPQVGRLGQVGQYVAGTHVVDGDGSWHEPGEVTLGAYEGRVYELRRGQHEASI